LCSAVDGHGLSSHTQGTLGNAQVGAGFHGQGVAPESRTGDDNGVGIVKRYAFEAGSIVTGVKVLELLATQNNMSATDFAAPI
jgi:hypothetical protein